MAMKRRWKILALAVSMAVVALPASPAVVSPPRAPAAAPIFQVSGLPPVLLVPGWSHDATALEALRARLLQAGWAPESVAAVSFDDPVGSNREHAREIAQAVLDLRVRTGAAQVDVVAHSMGGLATRYYIQNGGADHVRRVVFLATPHQGTVSALFAWGDGAREMQPGSSFLLRLRRSPALPEGVRALTVRTPIDLHVLPPESAMLPGHPDLRVCCPSHHGLLDDAGTFEVVERFLKGPDGLRAEQRR